MLHLILTICQKVEKAFNKIVDGGEGGERELTGMQEAAGCTHVQLCRLLCCLYKLSGSGMEQQSAVCMAILDICMCFMCSV
jgi:hypothetical protein